MVLRRRWKWTKKRNTRKEWRNGGRVDEDAWLIRLFQLIIPLRPFSLASRPYNGRGRKPNLGLKPRVEGVKGERTERPARHPSTVRRLTNPAQHNQESSNHPRILQGKLRLASHPPYAFTLLLLYRIGLTAAISHREGLQLQTNF